MLKKILLTAIDDMETDVGGWNGIGNGGINGGIPGGIPGGIKPKGGGIKPTHAHATIFHYCLISSFNQSTCTT